MKSKLTKGQTAYVKIMGNASRYIKSDNPEDYIEEVIVTSVGSKFITVERGYNTIKFDMEGNQVTQYCRDYRLYVSKQDIIDEIELDKLSSKIRRKFEGYGRCDFTLDQLRRIDAIINEDTTCQMCFEKPAIKGESLCEDCGKSNEEEVE